MIYKLKMIAFAVVSALVLSLSMVSMPMVSEVEAAACTGGTAPVVEGTTLTDCYQRNITIGGNARTIRVWYTTDLTAYDVDGTTYVHGISGESQASDVADAVQESWEAFFVHSAIGGNTPHEPYINGCGGVLNIQMRDGKGWAGIAYWGNPGNCNIGIDSPMVLNGVGTGDDGVIFHEVQHYVQFGYDNGCYADFQPLYPAGNAWIEGWSNWAGINATNAAGDASYSVSSYNSDTSYYDLSYTDLHAGYLIQQYGGNGAPTDPEFGIKEVYEHYRKCDQFDDIFVMDETIQALTGGAKTEKWAFVDFEAAYYAYPYADPVTQPELVFPDADDKPTGTPAFAQNVSMSGGSQSWVQSSPDTWTGKYYRVNPQAGCEFVELHVETQPLGGEVGINFMAVNTGAPTVQRSAHIGDNATRFFAGFPANDQLVVNVTSFDSVMTYQVVATCATPTLNILEPVHNPGHAMVGDPSSPFATLTRFEVTSSGLPVSGINSSTISFDAEGDSPSLVAGSFQEVGPGEYWAAIIPPVKPAGTTFVDYGVCLNVTICDAEIDALLYVDPGNVDTVYLFDESGSMSMVDTPGEGSRIENAKKAGEVLPDLLRDGDRIGIIGHGGLDNPVGCGLPGGTGNCPNGNITRLARINNVSIPGDIAVAKAGVNSVTDRLVWTNTGQGLIDAKDMLLANPGNTNPDHIILLSDGVENVHPLYDTPAVRGALQAAGVCVDTIGLGPEAPGALLAQIAAQNCGTYIPVPTSGLGTAITAANASKSNLMAAGAPVALADAITQAAASDFYPAQLGIANANEYIDVEAQDSARLFHFLHRNVPRATFREQFAIIDKSARSFQFLAAAKQEDNRALRFVELLPPGGDPEKGWIPVSPPSPNMPPPPDWDIRNAPLQDVVIVKAPEPGQWGFRVGNFEIQSDFIMNLSVGSPIRLEGNLLNLTNGQAEAGDVVPIVATLMDHRGLIPGAIVAAAISNEGGTNFTLLLDDGNNNDGAAGDGIYGFPYSLTANGGSYGVRIVALLRNPFDASETLFREWNGGFWNDGQQDDGRFDGDRDQDGMPDAWERRCKLIVGEDDSKADNDRDGLSNIQEFQVGTSPCQPDTDRGGEQDGSEVNAQRNPLWAADDKAFNVKGITLRPLNKLVAVGWSQRPDTHVSVLVCVSLKAGELGECLDMGNKGDFILGDLVNDQTYLLTLIGIGEGGARGAHSDQMPVKPAEDPIPPQGAFIIGGPNVIEGGDVATAPEVVLSVDAVDTDSEFDGPAGLGSHSVPHGLVGHHNKGMFAVSGEVEMRFANANEGIGTTPWEPLSASKDWVLDCADGTVCTVYGQFRDGAGNESLVIDQRVLLQIRATTSVEIDPTPLQLSPGSTGAVDIVVKDVTDPDGLGSYDLTIGFDPLVVNVSSSSPGNPPFGGPICNPIPSNTGLVNCSGFQSDIPGPTGDVKIFDLGITAVGNPGEMTALTITINDLTNSNGVDIPARRVDGKVILLNLGADPSLDLLQDTLDGATGVKIDVTRVFDLVSGADVPVDLGGFQSELSYPSTCINILDVREMDFPIIATNINNPGGTTVFNGLEPAGVPWPADLGHALTRLVGSNQVSCTLTNQITSLTDENGQLIAGPAVLSRDLLRGDARADGTVNIADALFISQYLVGSRPACTTVVDLTCLHSVNAASVRPDGAFDRKSIADALFIAQFRVGLRDEFYNLVP